MTQFEAVKAYISLKALNSQRTSGKIAKKIFDLMTLLKPSWDFQVQEENKVYEKYPMLDPKTMTIDLGKTPEERNERTKMAVEIKKAFDDFGGTEFVLPENLDQYKFHIDLDSENLKLSGEDIANLAPFITFD